MAAVILEVMNAGRLLWTFIVEEKMIQKNSLGIELGWKKKEYFLT